MFGAQRDVLCSSGSSDDGVDDGDDGEGECDASDNGRVPRAAAEAESSEAAEDGFVPCKNE